MQKYPLRLDRVPSPSLEAGPAAFRAVISPHAAQYFSTRFLLRLKAFDPVRLSDHACMSLSPAPPLHYRQVRRSRRIRGPSGTSAPTPESAEPLLWALDSARYSMEIIHKTGRQDSHHAAPHKSFPLTYRTAHHARLSAHAQSGVAWTTPLAVPDIISTEDVRDAMAGSEPHTAHENYPTRISLVEISPESSW
jgi:hypothetical protein